MLEYEKLLEIFAKALAEGNFIVTQQINKAFREYPTQYRELLAQIEDTLSRPVQEQPLYPFGFDEE